MGVLNVNNIRDMRTDAANRSTIALRLGLHRARIYQTVLICLGWICLLTYTILALRTARHFLYLVTLPLYAVHLRGVWTSTDRALDKYLPLLVMSTFILAILY